MLPDKSEELTIYSQMHTYSRDLIKRSPIDMSICRSKYEISFLNSDDSETTSSSWQISWMNYPNLRSMILKRLSI